MKTTRRISLAFLAASCLPLTMHAESPQLDGVGAAMERMIEAGEIAGAVTLVASAEEIVHLETTGMADIAAAKPMREDTVFWIASMTKPVTGVAILMLEEEGKLSVTDPVARYIPEFADLETPSGRPANITLEQLLTHTSGLGEASREASAEAETLADLIPAFLAAPMQFEPGEQWRYCQSGINTAARIVEIVSGQPFEGFLEERLFGPLGMGDTAFYLTEEQAGRLATAYGRNPETGELEPRPQFLDPLERDRPPLGNGGLFSTAPDYARFCRMLLNGGALDGERYLEESSVARLIEPRTEGLDAGFVPGSAWGLATALVAEPQGVTAMLSPGTYGHGGLFGTQAWIDPVKDAAYILMVQRADFPNSDASEVRRVFQEAAAAARP